MREKKKKNKKDSNENFEEVRIRSIAAFSRWLIKILSGVLAIVFTWLKLKGISVSPFMNDVFSRTLFQVSIWLYFICWIYGNLIDNKYQEMTFKKAPNQGRFPLKGIFFGVVLMLVFGILCWVDDFKTFSFVLLGFWIINFFAWRYFKNEVQDSLDETEKIYREKLDIYGLVKFYTVKEYIAGRWQYWRFGIGAIVLIFICLIYFRKIEIGIASLVGLPNATLLPSLTIFLFVLIFEMWIWYFRIKSIVGIKLVEKCQNIKAYNISFVENKK